MVLIAGLSLLGPALLAMLDRFCGRWARPLALAPGSEATGAAPLAGP